MKPAPVSGGRTANRGGRPLSAQTVAIRNVVLELTSEFRVMTVRQVFYALVSRGIVPKDETRGYRPVQLQVLKMRREGLIPWSFIADGTRWQRRPQTWRTLEDATSHLARTYRRDLWRDQGVRVEVWLEKDALASVIAPTTEAWDVPLMISRGVSSATFLHAASEAANEAYSEAGITTTIMMLFDFDAGGYRAAGAVKKHFAEHATRLTDFRFLAVTPDQVQEWNLPTRPAKKTDPQAKTWGDVAVELDAISPDKLGQLVEDEIVALINPDAWNLQRAYEASEREILGRLLGAAT